MRAEVRRAVARGVEHLTGRQQADGAWRGEYGGPMFLLPMYVAVCHAAGQAIPEERRAGMLRYLRRVQNPNGSLGLHTEDRGGCLFTTALGYVAMRVLGADASELHAARARRWIHAQGTPVGAASWGKLLLATLGLYPYDGLSPVLPELWLLPRALPIHPGRLWCHTRQVYLPMAWLFGRRACAPEGELTRALRRELYDRPWAEVPFAAHRHSVAACDDRYPITRLYRAAAELMAAYDARHRPALRARALDELYDHICYEDQATQDLDIGPVNSVLNALVHHFAEPGGERFRRSFAALEQYLQETPEGILFNGYNSTALWDTAFAVQAILASPQPAAARAALERAQDFIRDNQVLDDLPEHARYFRHPSRGGWPFSDRAHGWPISDCTAEGLKAALGLEAWGLTRGAVPAERLEDASRLLLGYQNPSGGFATYELQRAGAWLEWLNPSQVFAGIMVEHPYVECTSSCLQALARARARFPGRFERPIGRALERGARFIRGQQRPDGSWVGSWAVCFSYAAWFGVRGLRAAGAAPGDRDLQRACGFLIGKQRGDGGFGEDGSSCAERRWVPAAEGLAAQTAWALSALVQAGLGGTEPARRAARFLLARQEADGGWPREPLVGVFNHSTLIDYDNYRRYFPVWALSEYDAALPG
ncbi:MAG TPA: terpene cyclase/mutase family protein [Myxococcota bacterium]|nr:terpene cyclase/mutase family protein [Myxococcota bacterium]HRY93234.1 terpene cyclase/mutase family protein [Myxococcota bacterium]HSA21037.1 terpene cyclase/mutase family protein [Myxococcota bacterium]